MLFLAILSKQKATIRNHFEEKKSFGLQFSFVSSKLFQS